MAVLKRIRIKKDYEITYLNSLIAKTRSNLAWCAEEDEDNLDEHLIKAFKKKLGYLKYLKRQLRKKGAKK